MKILVAGAGVSGLTPFPGMDAAFVLFPARRRTS